MQIIDNMDEFEEDIPEFNKELQSDINGVIDKIIAGYSRYKEILGSIYDYKSSNRDYFNDYTFSYKMYGAMDADINLTSDQFESVFSSFCNSEYEYFEDSVKDLGYDELTDVFEYDHHHGSYFRVKADFIPYANFEFTSAEDFIYALCSENLGWYDEILNIIDHDGHIDLALDILNEVDSNQLRDCYFDLVSEYDDICEQLNILQQIVSVYNEIKRDANVNFLAFVNDNS